MKTYKIFRSGFLFAGFMAVWLTFSSCPAQEDIFFLGNPTGVGIRALTMGGAYVAVADNNSAIYWNPAGLGQLRRMEMNVDFSHNKAGSNAAFLDNKSVSHNSFTRLNSIGFSYPVPTFQGSLVLSAAYNKVRDFNDVIEIKGLNSSYSPFPDFFSQSNPQNYYTDITGSLYQNESILHEGSLNYFTLAGAVEVAPNFFTGVSVNFISGSDDRNLQFSEKDINNVYHTPPSPISPPGDTLISDINYWQYSEEIVSKFSGTSFKIGALYRLGEMVRLGATVTPPRRLKIRENWSDNWKEVYDDNFTNTIPPDPAQWTYSIEEPFAFEAGASLNILNIVVSGAAEFQDWTQARFRTEPPVKDITKAEINSRIQDDFKSTTKIRLGSEFYIPLLRARLSAGYFYNPSPYRYEKVNSDRHTVNGGFSFQAGRQAMVTLGLAQTMWKIQTTDYLTNSPALEDKNLTSFYAGLTVRF